MWMLKKDKEKDATGRRLTAEGREEDIVDLLKEAYARGKETEHGKLLKERESFAHKENEWVNEIKNLEEAWQNRFNEKQEEIERIENKLNEERKSFEGRFEEKEEKLKEEFEKGVQEIEEKIRPLQKSPCCHELLKEVIECHKLNPGHPLRCSALVKEYISCVHITRMASLKGSKNEQTDS